MRLHHWAAEEHPFADPAKATEAFEELIFSLPPIEFCVPREQHHLNIAKLNMILWDLTWLASEFCNGSAMPR